MTSRAYRHPPTSTVFVPFRTPVRGHAFAACPGGGAGPAPGAHAELRREPDNPRDPCAIAVWLGTGENAGSPWRIGYLDRAVAARLAGMLDAGERIEARVDGWWAEPEGRWKRPVVVLVAARDLGEDPRRDPHDGNPAPARRPPAAPRRRSHWGEPARSVRRTIRP